MIENKYAKVEGHPNIVRDLKTNAILNTDSQSMQNYIMNKNKKLLEKKRLESMANDIEDLKSSINEIKNLLRDRLNG